MKLKIRRGSNVEVITGAERGKKGKVLAVDPVFMRVKVEGVRVQKKAKKGEGYAQAEGYIHYSNVRLVEASAKA